MSDAELVQNTREWLQARAGSVGASDVPDIVRRTKSGPSATRAALMALKALERLTGEPVETYQSKAMAQGVEREPLARAAYAFMFDATVEPPGIIRHPLIVGAHASPDGLIGDFGLVEIKCPQPAAHLATLISEGVERDYQVQMQWQLGATGRHWCDFVSWSPDFPPSMQLYVQRVERDPAFISELEDQVLLFLKELETKVNELQRRYGFGDAA